MSLLFISCFQFYCVHAIAVHQSLLTRIVTITSLQVKHSTVGSCVQTRQRSHCSCLQIIQYFSAQDDRVFLRPGCWNQEAPRAPALWQNHSLQEQVTSVPCSAVHFPTGSQIQPTLLFEGQATSSYFTFIMMKQDFHRLLLSYTVVTIRELTLAITEKNHEASTP